jgi:hypothetical protein
LCTFLRGGVKVTLRTASRTALPEDEVVEIVTVTGSR